MGIIGSTQTDLVEIVTFAHGPDEHADPSEELFDSPEVIFTLSDRWSVRTARGEAEVHPGLVVLANSQETYQCRHFEPVPQDRALSVRLSGLAGPAAGSLGEWLAHSHELPFVPLVVPLTPELCAYRQALLAESLHRTPGFRLKSDMLVGAMLVDLVRLLGSSERPAVATGPEHRRNREAVEAVRSFIDQHFAEDLTLSALAAVAGISPFHFSRLFKEQVGQSPHHYLLARRLDCAAQLLRETALPVTEIALDVGFGDVTHFGRLFRRATGVSPGSYRKRPQD